jgi:hypothetical protein
VSTCPEKTVLPASEDWRVETSSICDHPIVVESYDGIDEMEIGEMMGISSLAFKDWFQLFSDEPSRTPHPPMSSKWIHLKDESKILMGAITEAAYYSQHCVFVLNYVSIGVDT